MLTTSIDAKEGLEADDYETSKSIWWASRMDLVLMKAKTFVGPEFTRRPVKYGMCA